MNGMSTMQDMQDMLNQQELMSGLDMSMLPLGNLDFDTTTNDFSPLATTMQPTLQRTDTNASTTNGQQEMLDSQQDVTTNSAMQNDSEAGAGPLPTGFGMGPPASSSTLTEFTRRRNWSQRIIEEIKDFLHILTPDGRILYVSPFSKQLTGYDPATLTGRFIGEFVHPDDRSIFMREFNESLATGEPLRFFYRFKKDDGTYTIFECDGHPHMDTMPSSDANPDKGNDNPGGTCKGIFMMARPYPTKNAALLDSFLEHKIENVRLLTRIEELRREEAEETEMQQRQGKIVSSHHESEPAMANENPHRFQGALSEPGVTQKTPDYQGMPPPARPSMSNTALTRQNLDSALSSQRPDSMADKMSRYEGSNHLETIELLTGLQYQDGERSHGISTGDTSPALIRGDAGIAILRDRGEHGSSDKKKIKLADEFVCADCGTLDSPEWRKGPKGPKTLCNACGLRWAKKEKRRGPDGSIELGGSIGDLTPTLVKQDSNETDPGAHYVNLPAAR